jgi:ABC-type multidrug transport system fused ATPase/permease subunit
MKRIGGLSGRIDEMGSNLSFGEKQLICIARVILAAPKVCSDSSNLDYVNILL